MGDYEGARRVVYGEGAHFLPVCPECGRFVKADPEMKFWGPPGDETPDTSAPNATCSKHGRIAMPFEGFY